MCVKTNLLLSQISSGQWNELLKNSSTASFFQSQKCFDFYNSLFFFEPFVFSVTENDSLKGVIIGYIQKESHAIKHFFTKRAIINGGPLLADDISENALEKLLLVCIKELKHKAIYIETRNFNDYSKWRNVFEKCGFKYEPHYNFHLDCTDENSMMKRMSESKVRQIKKAMKSGIEIDEARDVDDVKSYYRVLNKLYRDKVKTPLFPLVFFVEFYKQNCGKIILVRLKEEVIGGIVAPILNERVIYEWFVAGADKLYKYNYPSIMATYAAIKYGCDNKFFRFDFMGAGKPGDGGYGVRDFKAKFGGELVEHGRFLYVNNKLLYFIGELGVQLLKKKK